jgi:hypothetical protein
MRQALLLGGLLGTLGLAASAQAQQAPAPPKLVQMEITAPEAEVRSGPSPTLYVTAKLPRGAQVQVIEGGSQSPDWLAIKPPEGSFSWIDARYVKRQGQFAGFVDGNSSEPPVEVLAGSALINKKPDVVATSVARGTTLVILGEPMRADNGSSWLPIQPTAREKRYISAKAVMGSRPIPVAGAVAGPVGAIPSAAAAGLSVKAQADRAFDARDYATARRLYEEAASRGDNAEKSYCYGRLSQLDRLGPQAGAANTTSLYTTTSATRTGPGDATGLQWSTWGRLRKTKILNNGQPVYVLEDGKGRPLLYAATSSNLTLESYVNREVCLYGQVSYWTNNYVRANGMTVSHVALPPR